MGRKVKTPSGLIVPESAVAPLGTEDKLKKLVSDTAEMAVWLAKARPDLLFGYAHKQIFAAANEAASNLAGMVDDQRARDAVLEAAKEHIEERDDYDATHPQWVCSCGQRNNRDLESCLVCGKVKPNTFDVTGGAVG